jgi:hypothetical protein
MDRRGAKGQGIAWKALQIHKDLVLTPDECGAPVPYQEDAANDMPERSAQ